MVNFVEHELAGDPRLSAVLLAGLALKRRHHLLHNLVEEDGGQLRVEEGAELEGDLQEARGSKREGELKHEGNLRVCVCEASVCTSQDENFTERRDTLYPHIHRRMFWQNMTLSLTHTHIPSSCLKPPYIT